MNEAYREQVRLMLDLLPFIAEESAFALKGGTAINFFVRDMPRLSVDIDLTYLPLEDRAASLAGISATLARIKAQAERRLPGARLTLVPQGDDMEVKVHCQRGRARVKVEVNPLQRGALWPVRKLACTDAVQEVFESFVEAASLLVARKVQAYGLGGAGEDARQVADGVRQKLWSIGDEVRRAREVVAAADQPQLRLALSDAPPAGDDAPLQVLSDQRFHRTPPAPDAGRLRSDDDAPIRGEPALASTRGFEVLSDEDLAIDLGPGLAARPLGVQGSLGSPVTLADVDPQLLDKTVQSNLELVRRFGELDEKRLLLEHKVQELVEAAQQTVHDLNRPLTAMRLLLSTIDKGAFGPVAEPVSKAVQTGLQAVRQMDRLVHDLLDSSRLDHDGVRLQFAECDLGALVGEVVQLLRFEVAESGARVHVDRLPVVRADGWALHKVFMNLIGNALSYAKPGQPPTVRITAEATESAWRIRVADDGIGIPADDRSRLFRRFERGSNAAGVGGTGLGLHIVRELVHGHGGEVAFDSSVGVGTTFVVELPKAPVHAPHSPTSAVAERYDR